MQIKIGFAGLLTLIFIICKLAGVNDWSWLWVLSPLWISFSVFLTFAVGLTGLAVWLGEK